MATVYNRELQNGKGFLRTLTYELTRSLSKQTQTIAFPSCLTISYSSASYLPYPTTYHAEVGPEPFCFLCKPGGSANGAVAWLCKRQPHPPAGFWRYAIQQHNG